MLTGSRSAPAGLVQHGRAEDFIDAGLISLPLGFKPRKDVGVNSECERLFNRAIEFPNYRATLDKTPAAQKVVPITSAML